MAEAYNVILSYVRIKGKSECLQKYEVRVEKLNVAIQNCHSGPADRAHPASGRAASRRRGPYELLPLAAIRSGRTLEQVLQRLLRRHAHPSRVGKDALSALRAVLHVRISDTNPSRYTRASG